MKFRIANTLRAQRDLDEIASYTMERWGSRQADRYMYDLDGTIASLADSPAAKGISVNRAGVRRLRHRDHYFVFFRIVGDRVEVLRILHQRRDWPKILNNR